MSDPLKEIIDEQTISDLKRKVESLQAENAELKANNHNAETSRTWKGMYNIAAKERKHLQAENAKLREAAQIGVEMLRILEAMAGTGSPFDDEVESLSEAFRAIIAFKTTEQ